MRISDFLDMDPLDLMTMEDRDIRKMVTQLNSAANKRLKRAATSEFKSPAVKRQINRGKFSNKGGDRSTLLRRYAEVRSFLSEPTATAAGYKAQLSEFKAQMEDEGYRVGSLADAAKLVDAYDRMQNASDNRARYKAASDAAEILGVGGPKEAMDILNDMESAFRDVLGEDEEDDYNADDFWDIPD